MAQPWYSYPLDSPGGGYQEMIDPMGNYLKPDTNIAVPAGTPITTWNSGTITSIVDRGRTLAGLSVTEKLDNPPNNEAQYASFNYLGNANVYVGQRVNAGQQIGTAGSPYGVNFALGLGPTPTWGTQCPQCHNIDPNLDPRIVLNALRTGKGIPSSNGGGGGGGDMFGLGSAVTSLEQSFTNMAEEIGVFILALVIIVLGILLLAGRQIAGFVEGTTKTAGKAAIVA
jgi:hypothetical protein